MIVKTMLNQKGNNNKFEKQPFLSSTLNACIIDFPSRPAIQQGKPPISDSLQ